MLAYIAAAERLAKPAVPPNSGLHERARDRKGALSMTVAQNARTTSGVNEQDAQIDLDLEDDHGADNAHLALHAGKWLKSDIVEPAQVSFCCLGRALRGITTGLDELAQRNASLCADLAIRFGKAFGVKTDTLLPMQTTSELAQAREREGANKVGKLARAVWSPAKPIIARWISSDRCCATFTGFAHADPSQAQGAQALTL